MEPGVAVWVRDPREAWVAATVVSREAVPGGVSVTVRLDGGDEALRVIAARFEADGATLDEVPRGVRRAPGGAARMLPLLTRRRRAAAAGQAAQQRVHGGRGGVARRRG